jgi:Zn-dependent M28 family amino/carboxypeptidase
MASMNIPGYRILRKAALFLVPLAALSCTGAEPPPAPVFNSGQAFSHLEQQVSFGPRVPGTDAHAKTRDWLAARLREHTAQVAVQTFRGVFAGKEAEMYNIVASFYPEKTERILLCAHWDSRPMADKDPDPGNRDKPVPGANDGASGVAVLLEVARILAERQPPVGVDIAFFDGEDGGDYNNESTWLLGSRHFAAVMPASYRPARGILLDMIGDRDLGLTRDYNSRQAAPALWNKVVEHCGKLGIPLLPGETGVLDDHIPLIERGIPTIDIIDFDYPWWHTVSDTPDKCSPLSLGKIGELVLSIVYEE